MKTQSVLECYCGFKNKIVFTVPTTQRKSWLESDCLSCGARYDVRVYPDTDHKNKLKLFKRVIKMSEQVLAAIQATAEKSAETYNKNGVLSGEEIRKRNRNKDQRPGAASKSFKTY